MRYERGGLVGTGEEYGVEPSASLEPGRATPVKVCLLITRKGKGSVGLHSLGSEASA